jgi:hypothetical protein
LKFIQGSQLRNGETKGGRMACVCTSIIKKKEYKRQL